MYICFLYPQTCFIFCLKGFGCINHRPLCGDGINENIYTLPRGVDFLSLINTEDGMGAREMSNQMWILSLKFKEKLVSFYYFECA